MKLTLSFKVFWISAFAWQYCCSELDVFRSFFYLFLLCCLLGCLFLSPNFCHWDANRTSHPWWWILEVSYLPTELCLRCFYLHEGGGDSSAVSLLEKIPLTMSLQFHSAENGGAASTGADGELSYSIFPACLEVLHRPHKGRKKPSYLFLSAGKMPFWCGWRESGWFSLAG